MTHLLSKTGLVAYDQENVPPFRLKPSTRDFSHKTDDF
jgi:hypothetical protein